MVPSGSQPTESPAAELRGPALWIAIGVLVGASVCGVLLTYFRTGPAGAFAAPALATPPGAVTAASPATDTGDATPAIATRIDLNRATQAELELLPGVGPTVAKRILEYRTQRGGFRDVAELDRIKGVGPRMLERLRPLVTVGR